MTNAPTQCRPARPGELIANCDVRLSVRTIGAGKPVLMIPSLGRGVSDFDHLAASLAQQGYMAILPEPRGYGGSTGPAPQTQGDLADDDAAVIGALCDGPADVVGHAFGQRVARTLGVRHPDKVRSIIMLAAGGRVLPTAEVARDLSIASTDAPDAERLRAMAHVFFARGHDPRIWIDGWSPPLTAQQLVAVRASPVETWWSGGTGPIMVVHALEDPISEIGNARGLADEFPERVVFVQLAHASHAMLPEQPVALAALIAAYLGGERDTLRLQAIVDSNVRAPS